MKNKYNINKNCILTYKNKKALQKAEQIKKELFYNNKYEKDGFILL